MVRAYLILIFVLAAADTAAQPAPAPGPASAPSAGCAVNMVRVPDDVRPVIEEWVAAEKRCAVTLSVRVLVVVDGLYVLASDDSGRIHERVVPDALTAAVLIASWAADDSGTPAPALEDPHAVSAPTPMPPPVPEPPAPTPAPMPLLVSRPNYGPGGYERNPLVPPPAQKVVGPRAFALGTMASASSIGLRLELDWMRILGITLGGTASASYTETDTWFYMRDGGGPVTFETRDLTAMFQVSKAWRLSHFELRAAIGFGAILTDGKGDFTLEEAHLTPHIRDMSPSAEAAFTAGVWTGRWGVRAGMVDTFLPDLRGDMWGWSRGILLRGYLGVVRAW